MAQFQPLPLTSHPLSSTCFALNMFSSIFKPLLICPNIYLIFDNVYVYTILFWPFHNWFHIWLIVEPFPLIFLIVFHHFIIDSSIYLIFVQIYFIY